MITVSATTMLVIGQVIVTMLYIYNLPNYSYAEKQHRELDSTLMLVLYAPTIVLVYYGYVPEYLIGFSVVTLLTICFKTTAMLSNFINLVISLLKYSAPTIFIIMEAISMLQSASALKFIDPKSYSRSARQLSAIFLLNSLLYIYLALTLVKITGYLDAYSPLYPDRGMLLPLIFYAVFKFGTILTALLKQPIYELLPLSTIAAVSALTLSLVPIAISVIVLGSIGNLGAILFIILTNFVSFTSLYNAKTIKSLLLFTTVLSNIFVLVLFIL